MGSVRRGSSMPTRRFDAPIEPMTLGNMGRLGVRSLAVSCSICHHEAIKSADPWPGNMPVPAHGMAMACPRCGMVGAVARPNWSEHAGEGRGGTGEAIRG